MIQFKQYASFGANGDVVPNKNGLAMLRIAKYLHQATPLNIPALFAMFINNNGSICWGLRFPDGNLVPCSDYLNDECFSKLIHYNEYEFKWEAGIAVKRPQPLVPGLKIRQEMQDAFTELNERPSPLVMWHYRRIEEVFGVDLDTY